MLFVVNLHVVWCLVSGLIVSGSGSGSCSSQQQQHFFLTKNNNNTTTLTAPLLSPLHLVLVVTVRPQLLLGTQHHFLSGDHVSADSQGPHSSILTQGSQTFCVFIHHDDQNMNSQSVSQSVRSEGGVVKMRSSGIWMGMFHGLVVQRR